MTARDLIRQTAARFRDAGIPDPRSDASLLLASLTGLPALNLCLDEETVLDENLLSRYRSLADQRLQRIPLQYLLGEAPFFHRLFKVDSRVLIPRPETELLCEWALEILRNLDAPRVLDLCCGSGCIGLTLKAERPDADVCLSDLSADALDAARENAVRLSLDVTLLQADLLTGFQNSSFDLIISNPPYIPSSECPLLQEEVRFEPLSALDGGADGLDFYRRIVISAWPVLRENGRLLLELGRGESSAVSALLQSRGYRDVTVRRDYAGIDRMISATHP